MSSQETVPLLTGGHLLASLGVLSSLAVRVLILNERTNHTGSYVVCGGAWRCQWAVLVEHNLAAVL
jgi:hypothetical protein